jgi:hypothetical protein
MKRATMEENSSGEEAPAAIRVAPGGVSKRKSGNEITFRQNPNLRLQISLPAISSGML